MNFYVTDPQTNQSYFTDQRMTALQADPKHHFKIDEEYTAHFIDSRNGLIWTVLDPKGFVVEFFNNLDELEQYIQAQKDIAEIVRKELKICQEVDEARNHRIKPERLFQSQCRRVAGVLRLKNGDAIARLAEGKLVPFKKRELFPALERLSERE